MICFQLPTGCYMCSCSLLTSMGGGGWLKDGGAPEKGIKPWTCGDDGRNMGLLPPGCMPACGATPVLTKCLLASTC